MVDTKNIVALNNFFRDNPAAALGFSGGADSSYLLYAGLRRGARIRAYFVKTAFQPEFELRDAQRVAKQVGADMTVIEKNILDDGRITSNSSDRCYYCKKKIFETLREHAAADGFSLIIDGTNADDDAGDRPGMKALAELSVRSPLRECGITKNEIRRLSREAGLLTWDKPAYACLATRIPAGRAIIGQLLHRIEKAEKALSVLRFTDFRVRIIDEETAKLQFPIEQMSDVVDRREYVVKAVKPYFSTVLLDLDGR